MQDLFKIIDPQIPEDYKIPEILRAVADHRNRKLIAANSANTVAGARQSLSRTAIVDKFEAFVERKDIKIQQVAEIKNAEVENYEFRDLEISSKIS